MGERTYEPLENLSYKKSNELCSAKYKATLLENQITAIALTRIEVEYDGNGENCQLTAKLYPGELKRLIGDPSHIYRTLKTVSKTMIGHTMLVEDGKGNFAAFPCVNDCIYQDGVFTVTFHQRLKQHIMGITKKYTTLELSVMTSFTKGSSFRLYEILKSHYYKIKLNGGRYQIEYRISELRFMLGLANSDNQGFKNEMARMGNKIDWDILFEKLPRSEKKYIKWGDLERYVIRPGQKELMESSDIRFEYEPQREGYSIGKIRFTIYENKPANLEELNIRKEFLEEKEKERQEELPRDLAAYTEFYDTFVGHNSLTAEDIDLMIRKANMDKELVLAAIKQADQQGETISNYVGWILSCIERGGYKQIAVVEGSEERAKIMTELREDIDSEKLKLRVWERTKEKEDFERFLSYENRIYGVTFEELECIYSPKEAVQAYIDWVKAGRN